VRAWFETYRLPVIISNCSNNYGPYQFPEKLIPLMILNAIDGLPLPVYGDGQYVRDWLFVEDHCNALELILENGKVGETYTISGDCELTNLHVIQAICQVVQESLPQLAHRTEALIRFVADRPGHDRRYSLDASKIKRELHWAPRTRWADGLGETVRWYIEHREWVEHMTAKGYSRERLGEI
jgi:dTDP-glucose 4,6-dehydratase